MLTNLKYFIELCKRSTLSSWPTGLSVDRTNSLGAWDNQNCSSLIRNWASVTHIIYNIYTRPICTFRKRILQRLLHQHNSGSISVSKNRLISAAVWFTAKSTGRIFSDNLITIISWGQLQGYDSVARDTFVGLGIINGFLPIHFVGLVNACGIRHSSISLYSSLVGNNYCWCRKYSMGGRIDRAELCRVS
jgi:hypothetical protein